jgi:small subunit ribosomal protein S19e
MVSIYEIDPSELVEKTGQELKNIKEIKPPAWAILVKTGAHKERPPVNKDWWHIRAAAIMRSIARLGPIGVSKLRTKYGGKKNRGHQPEKFFKGSGSIIRKILQQLDQAGLTAKVEKGAHKGRIISPKGLKLLNDVANKIKGSKPKKVEKKEEQELKKPEKELKKDIKKDEKTVEKLDKIEQKKQDKVKKLVKEEVKLVKEEEKVEKEIKKQEEKTEKVVKEKDEKVKKLEKQEAKVAKKEEKLEKEIKKQETAIENIEKEKEKAEEDMKVKEEEIKEPKAQDTNQKVAGIVEEMKKHATKEPTAEKIVEEIKESNEKEIKEKVPTAEELLKKKEEKKNG